MKRGWSLVLTLVMLVAGCNHSESSTDPSLPLEKPKPMLGDWPFEDPENLAVITLGRIMDGRNPILYVTHDEDDGGWQFLDGGDVTEDDAMVVSLGNVVDHDETIRELADLPIGWHAVRDKAGGPWQRNRSE